MNIDIFSLVNCRFFNMNGSLFTRALAAMRSCFCPTERSPSTTCKRICCVSVVCGNSFYKGVGLYKGIPFRRDLHV